MATKEEQLAIASNIQDAVDKGNITAEQVAQVKAQQADLQDQGKQGTDIISQTKIDNTNNTNNTNQDSTNNQSDNNTSTTKKQPNITNVSKEPLAGPIRFGYETALQERQTRNQDIADKLFQEGKPFDEAALSKEIQTLAPDVTAPEIQNTVNDIKNRLQGIKAKSVRANELDTMSGGDLANMDMNGNLSNSDKNLLKENNPVAYQEYLNSLKQKQAQDTIEGRDPYGDFLSNYETKINGIITAQYGNQGSLMEAWKKISNSDEILAAKENFNKLNREAKDLRLNIESVEDDVRKELGADATESYILAKSAKRTKELQKTYNTKLNELSEAQSNVQALTEDAKTNFDIFSQDFQISEQRRNNIINAQLGIAGDVFNKQRSMIERKLDKEDAIELKKMDLYEQLDVSKMTKDRINELDIPSFLKDYMNFKKDLGIDKEAASTIEYDGVTYFLDSSGNIINKFDTSTAGIQLGMEIKRDNPNNVSKDANNPGNITVDGFSTAEGKSNYASKYGAIGTYKSPNGREYLVFKNNEDGARALRQYVSEKAGGQSYWADPNMTIGKFLTGYVKGPKSLAYKNNSNEILNTDYGQAVMGAIESSTNRELKLDANTRLGDINIDSLANGIAKAEGFGDISGLGFSTPISQIDTPSAGEIQMWKNGKIGGTTGLTEKRFSEVADYMDTVQSPMTKDQITILNTMVDNFRADASVKDFETALSQSGGLIAGIEANSGPGDMAAIFSFMKSLDPTSVVREGEYAAAAQSLGLLDQLNNMVDLDTGKLKGSKFTKEAGQQFIDITKEVLKRKAKDYNKKYDRMITILDMQGVPQEARPVNVADGLMKRLDIGDTSGDGNGEISAEDAYNQGKNELDNILQQEGIVQKK